MAMHEIHDQYNGDPAFAELHVLTRERPLAREIIKTGEFTAQKLAVENLPSTVFAWEDERRFPVHTKADTVASILYRSKLGSSVPKHVDEKLTQACEIYGIEDHVFSGTKTAAAEFRPEPIYALQTAKRLPLDSSAQVKQAEEVLNRDYTKLNLETRADAYSRLTKQASVHGVELGIFTKKMAGLTASSTALLRTWLGARAAASQKTGAAKYAAAYDKLSDELAKAPAYLTDRTELVKLAGAIDTLDRGAGLDKHYDRKLPDPMQTVFNTELSLKTASCMVDLAGTQVPCETLMQLPPEVWHQVDMPEMAEIAQSGDPNQFKQVFDTIPMDVKMVLAQQLR